MRFLSRMAAISLLLGPGIGANEPTAKPLPGNKACPYPAQAQKDYVAGPVHFSVQVRPDGTTESVDVKKVPVPGIGFEETVRTCVSEWRFEPAPDGVSGLRRHDGRLRFRIDAAAETAIRNLLESLAASWNAGDLAAVEELAVRAGDSETVRPEPRPPLQQQLRGQGPAARWRMDLAPEIEHVRLLKPDLAAVRQPYRRTAIEGGAGTATGGEETTIDAVVVKGSRGWRLLRTAAVQREWLSAVRVGGTIREPRKVKDARPLYPEVARESGVQGVVILECLISPEGKVTNVRVLHGHPLLRDAAAQAVRRWEYTPTLLQGIPVPVIMTVTVNFRLR